MRQGVLWLPIPHGAAVGLDTNLTKNTIVGVEFTADNVFDRRDLGVGVRAGVVVVDTVLVYGKVGYTNFKDAYNRELDGLRLGGGLEVNLTDTIFTGVEYRYTDFEQNTGKHGVHARVGIRF